MRPLHVHIMAPLFRSVNYNNRQPGGKSGVLIINLVGYKLRAGYSKPARSRPSTYDVRSHPKNVPCGTADSCSNENILCAYYTGILQVIPGDTVMRAQYDDSWGADLH